MVERGERRVQVPAFMLGTVTLLWGWHQDALVYAAVAALALELARFVPFRWDFDDDDFHRLGDVSAVGLVLLAVVQFSDRGMTGIYGVLRWFPLVVIGLTLAQLYSTRTTVRLSAMFLSVRFAMRRGQITYPGELDMCLPYLIACLLSATAGAGRSALVMPLEALILVWLLLANRSRSASGARVLAALVLCAGVTVVAAASVTSARKAIGPVIMDIVRERITHWRDPFRNHTALGEIGRVKVSDRIVLRIESPPGTPVPALLHEASYQHLSKNVWLAGETMFTELTPGADGTRWDLAEAQRPFRTVTVSKGLIRNKGMIPLPPGAFRIDELPVEVLKSSALGALKVDNGPALVRFRVRYGAGASGRVASPLPGDTLVPRGLEALLARTLEGLELPADASPRTVVNALIGYFNDGFRYSLDLERSRLFAHPLEQFLEDHRSGHCEFFATATVMLLRAAGIPARYATGYAVQEYSQLEEAWIVRRRHSHAWASAWIDGRWVDIDTTPVQWVEAEADGAAWWEPVYDGISWLWYRFSRWRLDRVEGSDDNTALLWVLLPLGLFLAWRVYHSRRVGRAGPRTEMGGLPPEIPGTDSDFYRLESWLAARGLERPAPWTPRRWLTALEREGRLPEGVESWREIVTLHYRLRFAPQGLAPEERRRLAAAVDRALASADAATS